MDGSVKQKIVVVLGPTASGKTALSVSLAKQYGGEIISADSMQIYKGLDIGTAKASKEEQCAIPHHLIDIAQPQELFSVANFLPLAQQKIAEIAARGALPIVCGGTGLYLSSLVNGVRFTEEKTDPALRDALRTEFEEKGAQAMLTELSAIDPVYAAKLHLNDTKRILRALELYRQTGKTMSRQLEASLPDQPPYNALLLGLNYASREVLYDKINRRVDQMIQAGVLEEALKVWQHRASWTTAAQAIGYKEFFPYFEGAELTACTEKLKQATRNYAKRQLSWFQRMPQVQWLDAEHPDCDEIVRWFMKGANDESAQLAGYHSEHGA